MAEEIQHDAQNVERQLRTTLGKLEIVLGSILEAIAWTDEKGIIQWCNASFDQLCQKNHLQVLGGSFFDLLPVKKDGKAVPFDQHVFNEALITKIPQSGIYEVTCPDQKKKMIYIFATRTEPKEGEITMILVSSDITTKWEGQKQLEEKTAFVHLLKTVAIQANEAKSIDQALETTLREVCELTGWPVGHVYFRSTTDRNQLDSSKIWYLKNPEQFKTFREITEKSSFNIGDGLPGRVLETGKSQWIKDVMKDPKFTRAQYAHEIGVHAAVGFPVQSDGEVVAVLEFFSPEPKEPNRALLEVMTHIGTQLGRVIERERAQANLASALEQTHLAHEDLKRAQSQLIQSDRLASLGQLAAGVAHEINNPVGFVTSNLTSLERYLNALLDYERAIQQILADGANKPDQKIPPVILEMIDTMGQCFKIDLIRNDSPSLFSETRSGLDRIKKIVSDLKTFARSDSDENKILLNVNNILDSVISIVWNEIKYKAELQKEYCEVPMIYGHSQQLGQVFMNLLVNAAQAIEKTPGLIILKTFVQDDFLVIQISDNGVGMPENVRAHIFDPFFTTKPVGQGTGLGLSISYDIIKKHTGKIEVQSTIGQGSTFSIHLPISKKP